MDIPNCRLRSTAASVDVLQVGHDVSAVAWRDNVQQVAKSIGDPVSNADGKRPRDAGRYPGDHDAQEMANIVRIFTPEPLAHLAGERSPFFRHGVLVLNGVPIART